MKSFGVGDSGLSICTEFLSDRRQRVVVDGAASEWIPIIKGVPQESMLGPLLFILCTREMFELVEDILFAYADDSMLLAVVRNPPDRPAVSAFLNRDFPVKNYRRGITDFFGVILLKRRRIAGEVSTLWRDKAVEWAGTAVFGLYIHMYI